MDKEMIKIRDISKLIKKEGTSGQEIGQLPPEELNRVNLLLTKYQLIKQPINDISISSELLNR